MISYAIKYQVRFKFLFLKSVFEKPGYYIMPVIPAPGRLRQENSR
jgi:hypothetical protein